MGPRAGMQQGKLQNIIWTVRHGQRIDNIDPNWRKTAPRGAWDDPTLR